MLRRMWADGGPRGLFRGNMATVILFFSSFSSREKRKREEKESLRASLN